MKRLPLLVVLGMLGVASTASAQSRRAASRVHDFHTLDRYTPMTTFSFEYGFESWSDPKLPLVNTSTEPVSNAMPLELHFHYVLEGGAGVYATMPMTIVSTRDAVIPVIGTIKGKTKLALGNIDVGAMYAARIGGNADFVAHVGVALPTSTDDSDVAEAYGNFGGLPRLSDYALRWPDQTFLRIGMSPMGRIGPAFWQFDAGLDVKIAQDDDYPNLDPDPASISPLIHVNAGGGFDFGKGEATAELATLITNRPDNGNNSADNVNSTLAFGARYKDNNVAPGVAFVIPMSIGDAPVDQFNFAVLVDLSARLP